MLAKLDCCHGRLGLREKLRQCWCPSRSSQRRHSLRTIEFKRRSSQNLCTFAPPHELPCGAPANSSDEARVASH